MYSLLTALKAKPMNIVVLLLLTIVAYFAVSSVSSSIMNLFGFDNEENRIVREVETKNELLKAIEIADSNEKASALARELDGITSDMTIDVNNEINRIINDENAVLREYEDVDIGKPDEEITDGMIGIDTIYDIEPIDINITIEPPAPPAKPDEVNYIELTPKQHSLLTSLLERASKLKGEHR